MSKIRYWWWKILGVVIFLYVLIGGMLTPLKPGVVAVNPQNTPDNAEVELMLTGYNSHFLAAKNQHAWLKLDSTHIVKAIGIDVLSETEMKLKFQIPTVPAEKPKVVDLTLIINNEIDGSIVLPSAVFVNKLDSLSSDSSIRWSNTLGVSLQKGVGFKFPFRNILNETIRNTFFHVAIWMAMFALLTIGLYNSIQYLRTKSMEYDLKSASLHHISILYGILGLITGSIWAKFTWGTFWTTDIKLNMTAVAMLIYFAYSVLRSSILDPDKKARLSAVFSIFSFAALIPLVFVIPRLTDSLHPGNGGNPALGGEDLDNTLRMFFYPAIIALFLLGLWMAQLLERFDRLQVKILQRQLREHTSDDSNIEAK